MEQVYLLFGIKKKGISMMYRLDVRVIYLYNSPSGVKGIDFFYVINSEILTLAHLENGNIIDNMKKGKTADILYRAIERMNNELYVTVKYELEGYGAHAEPVLLHKDGQLELKA